MANILKPNVILNSIFEKAQWHITYRAYVTSPEANGAEGLCGGAARRSAAEPKAPASGADAHTRCYVPLCHCSCYTIIDGTRSYSVQGKLTETDMRFLAARPKLALV
jgi:hypothetical protein